jgi:DNA-binding winged helix-turn-helix (wHTH) protein/tetratricopeptide (TPR) repeat protein
VAYVPPADPAPSRPSSGLRSGRLWQFAGIRFDEASRTLLINGAPVALESRPLELLRLLLEHAGELITKDEIMDAVWPGRVVTEASLTKCVARLRQVLNDSGQTLIRTVHGYGYRLVAEVDLQRPGATAADDGPGFGLAVGAPVPLRPNWRCVERLLGGGIGEVWLAEQSRSHERRVFKFARSGVQLTALKREITLFRVLNDSLGARDDLARISDWNLDEAPYFIELEYSPDGNLAAWAAREGGIGSLPMAERLRLIAEIADALAAAHSVGVLHKDLKPANVLIRRGPDGRPQIRLTDFGSGRLFDSARLDALGITRLGLTRGDAGDDASSGSTPLYLAPELLTGQPPTVRADLYALGVMLYQFIVGDLRRPLAPGWEADIGDELLREDILLAAAGDPGRRLADAATLAERLRSLDARREQRQRARAAEAESLRLQQALSRASARRGLLRALAITAVAALAVTSWLYWRADAASRRAVQEAANARAVTDFLTRDVLSAGNPLLAADPALRVRDLLGTAAADLDRRFAAGSLPRAAIEEAIGQAWVGLSDTARARPLLEAAFATRKRLLGPGHPDTLAVQMSLIELLDVEDDLPAVQAGTVAVLDAARAAGTLSPELELNARQSLIAVDCMRRRLPEACLAPEQALLAEVRQRLGPAHELAISVANDVAFDLADAQRFDEAIPLAREVLALTRETFGDRHLLTASRQRRLGTVLNKAGRYDEAVPVLREARERTLAATGRENEYSITAANDLAYAWLKLGRPAEALPLFEAGVAYQRAKGSETPKLARSLNHVATTLAALGRHREAALMQQETLAIDRRVAGPDHPDTLTHAINGARFLADAGDLPAALALADDTLARVRRVYRGGEWDLGWYLARAGELHAAAGQREQARALLQESISTLTAALGPGHAHTQQAVATLAALR